MNSGAKTPLEKIEYLMSRMNQDGLEYTFKFYSKWEDIEDKKFHKLRKKYIQAHDKLEKRINKLYMKHFF